VKLKLKDVLPNPYRDLKGNPLREDKLAELEASIHTTGFWDNVVVRKNKAGKYELAYGHHRVEAARRAGLTEVDFIVKEFSDEQMIQVMDSENRETYQSSPASVIESVRAVVNALAKGSIKPFELAKDTRKETIRYTPSFIPNSKVDTNCVYVPYTALSIARFLGRTLVRPEKKGEEKKETAEVAVTAALDALHLLSLGRLTQTSLANCPNIFQLKNICDPIKRRLAEEVKRRNKTQAEIRKIEIEQAEEERKAKAAEKKAEEARIKVRKAAAKVKRDRENEEKKERLKKAQEDMDRAEELAKETADIAAEGLKIANARAREKAEQAKKADEEVAAYASTFTLFQGIQREVNRIAEEHGALWDKVMSLHKSNVTPAHRQIIWDAFKLAATRCDNLGNKLEVTLSGKLKKEKK